MIEPARPLSPDPDAPTNNLGPPAGERLARLLADYDRALRSSSVGLSTPSAPELGPQELEALDRAKDLLQCLDRMRPQQPATPDRVSALLALVEAEVQLRRDLGMSSHFEELQTHLPTLIGSGSGPKGTVGLRGRFTVLNFVAQGGLGRVSLARDEKLRRQVALKEIRPDRANSPDLRRRFINEAEVTGGLEHPGIVPVYTLEEDDRGRPFYAMRFIQGRTLTEAIHAYHKQPTPLVFRGLLKRFADVCQAVAYASGQGVIHRDLKPDNVMLGDFGETLVVDWGLAKKVASGEWRVAREQGASSSLATHHSPLATPVGTQAGSILGTPGFMAPEQAEGDPAKVGPASDVYALGAILYVLLTDQLPYKGPANEVLEKLRAGPPPRPRQVLSRVPPALEAVCLKAMARRPEDRYAAAADLAGDVDRWLADEPVSAYREPLLTRLARWGRRNRTLVTAGVVLLATAAMALAVGLVLVGRERDAKEQARAQAVQDRKRTRQALDEMSSGVIKSWLVKQTRLSQEQKDFLTRSLADYEEFARATGDDDVRLSAAEASLRVGDIRGLLGQPDEAEAAYRQGCEALEQFAPRAADPDRVRTRAVQGYRKLGTLLTKQSQLDKAESAYLAARDLARDVAARAPGDAQAQHELAACDLNLGTLRRSQGDLPQAVQHLQDAAALLRPLVERPGADREWLRDLAAVQSVLGTVLQNQKKLADAEAVLRVAKEVLRQLADQGNTDSQEDLASCQSNLAVCLFNLASRAAEPKETQAEAITEMREAVSTRRQLAAGYPAVPEYWQRLARLQHNLGLMLSRIDQDDEAREAFEGSVAVWRRLVNDYPKTPEYRNGLGTSLTNLANWHLQRAHLDEAQKLVEEAEPHHLAALKATPKQPEVRMFYASNRIRLTEVFLERGDHKSAAAVVSVILEYTTDPVEDRVVAAGFLARCAGLAGVDADLLAARQTALAKEYGDRAMALLKEAVQGGFADAKRLRQGTMFEALRGRTDFQQLLR